MQQAEDDHLSEGETQPGQAVARDFSGQDDSAFQEPILSNTLLKH
jgi:hypothetical protein